MTTPPDLGTIAGSAELALTAHQLLLDSKPCPDDINAFGDYMAKHKWSYYDAFFNDSQMSNAARQEELIQTHSFLRWVDFGLPVFDLTHSFMAALLLTDPAGVDCSEVRLPFPTFAIRLPSNFWTIRPHDDRNAIMPAAHAFVHNYTAMRKSTRDTESMICMRIVGRSGQTSLWEIREPIPLLPGRSIGDWMKDEVPPVSDETGPFVVVPPEDDEHHILAGFRRLVVNLCLYIAEHGRGERLGGKVDKHKSKPTPDLPLLSNAPNVWIIGREVKLPKELVDAAKGQTGRTSAWKLAHRFTVRGHWKNIPHGPGRTERRRQWIAPYWKGQGPTFSHIYRRQGT
jgi:hypothetical protein